MGVGRGRVGRESEAHGRLCAACLRGGRTGHGRRGRRDRGWVEGCGRGVGK